MAITGGVEFVPQKKDKSLQELLKGDTNVVKFEGKIKDLTPDTTANETERTINELIEDDFDNFFLQNENKIKDFFVQNKYYTLVNGQPNTNLKSGEQSGQDRLSAEFRKYIESSASGLGKYLEQLKNNEINEVIKNTKIELNNLDSELSAYLLGEQVKGQSNQSNNTPTGDKPRSKYISTGTEQDFVDYRGKNTSISYTADTYVDPSAFNEKDNDLKEDEEKKALKRLLKGKTGFWGKVDEELDIVDRNDKTSGTEKKMLSKLKSKILKTKLENFPETLIDIIKTYNEGQRFSLDKGWRKKAKEYGDKDNYVIGAMYQIYREDIPGFPYLKRVMGLFVQEFARENKEIENNGEQKNKSMVDIYNEHNDMPTNEKLELVSGKSEAIRVLKDASEEKKTPIRKLLRLSEGVDMARVLSYIDAHTTTTQSLTPYTRVEPPKDKLNSIVALTKKEEKIINLYKENIQNDVFVKVFEGLAMGMTVQEIVNAGKLELGTTGPEETLEQNFLGKLCDLNADGRNDFGDQAMVKGLQLQNMYEETKVMFEGDKDHQIIRNMLTYSEYMAKALGYQSFENKIQELLAKTPFSFQVINAFFNDKVNTTVLKFIQQSLIESPLPVTNILKYGKNAYQEFYNNSLENIPNDLRKKIEEKLNQVIKINDLDPATKEGLIQAANSFIMTKLDGAGMSASINIGNMITTNRDAVDFILSGLAIDVGVGVANSKDNIQSGVVGLYLSWNKGVEINKTTAISGGVSTGGGFAEGFIPMWSLSAGIAGQKQINENHLKRTLDPHSIKKISLGANVALINYSIPSRGIQLGYEADKMKGIESQYNTIKKSSESIARKALLAIKQNPTDRVASLNAIQGVLKSEFGSSDEEALKQAAFNIFQGIQAFNLSKADYDNMDKTNQVASMIGEFYALSRKNAEVTGLSGRKFDGVQIGVQFLAGFIPIPVACLQIAKYKDLYYEDTKESKANVNKAEVTGDGNEVISTKITEKEIKLINDMIEIPFHNTKSKLNFKLSDKDKGSVPDIMLNPNNTISIPQILRENNILNINIDPILKGHIKLDNGYLQVPAQIPMRLFMASTDTESTYVLNLGDNKSDGGKMTIEDGNKKFEDITLRAGNSIPGEWNGDPTKPVFEQIIKAPQITELISKLNNGDFKNFPLSTATKSTEKGKEKQTVFTLKPQINGKPIYQLSDKNATGLTLDKEKLTLAPETGELIVNYEKANDKYVFSYKEEPKTSLRISYKIDSLSAAEKWNDLPSLIFDENNKLFNFGDANLSTAKDTIDRNIVALKNAEHGHKEFSTFMDNLWNIKDTDRLDQKELKDAKVALLAILHKQGELYQFINTLREDNTGYQTLAYIMDRMKQVFAMENYYKTLDQMRLPTTAGGRGDKYQNLDCPSKTQFPTSITRDLIKGKGTTTETFSQNNANKVNNLVGYTAFYRKEGSPARSMTAPGSTTVYGNFISDKLDDKPNDNKLTDGKNRFIGNLEKQTYEKELLLKAVESRIPREYKLQITPEDVVNLLKKGESGISIDNGAKKYKLTLLADYHFYLLGECANESLGIKIGGLKIQEVTKGTGSNSSGDVTYGYENPNIGVHINTPQTRSEALRGREAKRTIGISAGVAAPKDVPEKTDGGNSDQGINGQGGNSDQGVNGQGGNSDDGVDGP